jgi:glutathione S-transferase
MITLRTSPGSPFGRKPRMAIEYLGLSDRVTVVASRTSDPDDPIHRFNPLRKMPVLILEDGTPIYDSRVIVEYLDWLAGGGGLLPKEPEARFAALTMQALADGLTEATVLIRYEARWHEELHMSQSWLAHQSRKIDGALAELDRAPPPSSGLDVGQIAVACALDYYDRAELGRWRDSHPRLLRWFETFQARTPAFSDTQAPS